MKSTTPEARVEQFRSDVAAMKPKTGAADRERPLQVLGAVLLVAGVAVALGCYVSSTNQDDPRDQTELVTLAVAGVCLTLTGAALFLRYSLARFLRLWLQRQTDEAQANTDRVVDALRRR
jgi:hypothetical protein